MRIRPFRAMATATTQINGWESYPLCLPSSFYEDVDRKSSGRLLDSAEGRLFSGHDDVEVWVYGKSSPHKVKLFLSWVFCFFFGFFFFFLKKKKFHFRERSELLICTY